MHQPVGADLLSPGAAGATRPSVINGASSPGIVSPRSPAGTKSVTGTCSASSSSRAVSTNVRRPSSNVISHPPTAVRDRFDVVEADHRAAPAHRPKLPAEPLSLMLVDIVVKEDHATGRLRQAPASSEVNDEQCRRHPHLDQSLDRTQLALLSPPDGPMRRKPSLRSGVRTPAPHPLTRGPRRRPVIPPSLHEAWLRPASPRPPALTRRSYRGPRPASSMVAIRAPAWLDRWSIGTA